MTDGTPSDAAELTPEQVTVAAGLADRMARYASGFNRVTRSLALVVSITGLAALVVACIAWRSTNVMLGITAVMCLPAWLAPMRVIRRSTAMAAAAADPDGVIYQAKDLVRGLRGSTELQELQAYLSTELRGADDGDSKGILRRARSYHRASKLLGRVVDRGRPDRKRHP